jgi:hypothetical protein
VQHERDVAQVQRVEDGTDRGSRRRQRDPIGRDPFASAGAGRVEGDAAVPAGEAIDEVTPQEAPQSSVDEQEGLAASGVGDGDAADIGGQ